MSWFTISGVPASAQRSDGALKEIAILSGCAEIPVAQLDRARRHRESRNIEKSSVRRSIKKKAGGRYAADLVLQLPARGSGSVALHSG